MSERMLDPGAVIMVVDDDETFRTRLVKALTQRGFEAIGFGAVQSAVDWAKEHTPEFAVVDMRLGEHSHNDGLDVIESLQQIDAATRIVVLTGYGSIATTVEAMRRGAVDYLTKPADAEQILAALAGRKASLDPDTPKLADVEWEHIQRVLRDCNGNITIAARVLGLHRRSLQRKLARGPQ